MRRSAQFFSLFMVAVLSAHAVPAVLNYAGQVAVNGQPFGGLGLFKFALVNADGNATFWSNDGTSANGSEPAAHVSITVDGGLYSLLLGNVAMAGMGAIDPQIFAQHGDAKLRVWFSDGVNGFQQLNPDRPFASVPYAFSAGTAQSATIADGSVTASKIANKTIGKDQISDSILKYLKPEITVQPEAQTVNSVSNVSFPVTAEGKYLTYQWKKDGVDLAGETNVTLTITDANATQHDGNYSVVVSNDFGNVESEMVEVKVSDALMNGLVGWWKFDETNGKVAFDSSGNGNDGNLTGGPAWTTGKIGGALSFDGVDDYVSIPNIQNSFSNEASMSAWIKVNESESDTNYKGGLMHLGTGINLHYKYRDGLIYMNIFRHDSRVNQISTDADIFSWHNLAITTKVGAYWKMFIDASLIKKVDATIVGIPTNCYFGRSSNGSSWTWMDGLIDDIRIYDRALSASEVQALYNMGQ